MTRQPRIPRPEHCRVSGLLEEFMKAVVRGTALDPITTELVRLRVANYHDCHT